MAGIAQLGTAYAAVAEVVTAARTARAADITSSVDKSSRARQALCALETSEAWNLASFAEEGRRIEM